MRMRFGWTNDNRSVGSWLIRRVTGGAYSHAFVVFVADAGEPVYFESRANLTTVRHLGQHIRTTGLRGPRSMQRVADWVDSRPSCRSVQITPVLPFSAEWGEYAYSMLCDHVGRVRYAYGQIWLNWLLFRCHIHLRFRAGSVDRWTCSETCYRVTPPEWRWTFGYRAHPDDIAPAGPRYSVEAAVRRMVCPQTTDIAE